MGISQSKEDSAVKSWWSARLSSTVLIESLSVFRLTTSTYEFHFCLNLFHISLFFLWLCKSPMVYTVFFTRDGEVEFFPTFKLWKKVTINALGILIWVSRWSCSSKEPAYKQQETLELQVQSLDWEDFSEEEMTSHSRDSSCLGNPMDRKESGGLQSVESPCLDLFHISLFPATFVSITYGTWFCYVTWEVEFFPTLQSYGKGYYKRLLTYPFVFSFESFHGNVKPIT